MHALRHNGLAEQFLSCRRLGRVRTGANGLFKKGAECLELLEQNFETPAQLRLITAGAIEERRAGFPWGFFHRAKKQFALGGTACKFRRFHDLWC
jgi:hypothetical protein